VLTDEQKRIVRVAQGDLPLASEPFTEWASEAGCTTEGLLTQLRAWLRSSVIRRFGAILDHHKAGFQANGMAVFRVPPERVDVAGARLAERPEVTHCYQRPTLPDWPYNLFAMVHGRSAEEVQRVVASAAEELGVSDYDILFSSTEYKKTSMTYFAEEPT
jgi:DNA-binding Lrp family transcriptional regulator